MKLFSGSLAIAATVVSLLASFTISLPPPQVSYDGVKVMRIEVGEAPEQVSAVKTLIKDLGLAAWTDEVIPRSHADVEVPQEKWANFEKEIQGKGLKVKVMHEDLGESIRQESQPAPSATSREGFSSIAAADKAFFNNYHPYNEHLTFMNELVKQYPDRAEIIVAGNSAQGRPITGIHIYGSAGKGKRPAVIFHGTVHAREWVTTMTVQYFSWSLLSNYGNNATVKGYVDKYDFYIFPVVNPDGFVYTQTTQRLWRKARNPVSGSSCIGTDINRNWDIHWVGEGSSTDPCDDDFRGRAAGDTTEFKALSSFQNRLAGSPPGAKLYIDWHSYSQLFMSPYGWSCSVLPKDNTELVKLAHGYANAVKAAYGMQYDAGPICTTIYQVNGDSVDYSYDVSGIKYSFAAELRDTGDHGFVLPTNQILPTAEESWAGVKYLLDNIV